MGVVTKSLILISMMACITSVANAISGEAILYRSPYAPSRCFGPKDEGVMVARVHGSLFAYGKACGWKYRVRCTSGTNKAIPNACTGNTVDVTVVDRCETCGADVLELSQEAFAQIARPDLGKVFVEYAQIL